MRPAGVLQCVRVQKDVEDALTAFFIRLVACGADRHFHPHAFDPPTARQIAREPGADLYYALLESDRVLGYGMLRGWNDGFAIPSLGIAIDAAWQGRGLGLLLMNFLHAAARVAGASRIRLKVHRENARARALYERLGYRFEPADGEQHIGFLDLHQ
jgi:ribosomal protein S18 acetylase RimI-like enzyme